jgi:hypothetical protein
MMFSVTGWRPRSGSNGRIAGDGRVAAERRAYEAHHGALRPHQRVCRQRSPVTGVAPACWRLELVRCRGGKAACFDVKACMYVESGASDHVSIPMVRNTLRPDRSGHMQRRHHFAVESCVSKHDWTLMIVKKAGSEFLRLRDFQV